MRTCPTCGNQQDDRLAFCSNCGAVLDKPDTGGVAPAPTVEKAPEGTTSAASLTGQPDLYVPPVEHKFGDIGMYIVRRLLALAVDLLGVGFFILSGLHYALESGHLGAKPHTFHGFFLVSIYALLAWFLYRWLFEGLLGSTLGKLLFNLGVGNIHGGSAGLGRTLIRNVLLPVDLLVIGFLLAAVTPKRRRLGDLAAGTVVANSRIGALAPVLAVIALGVLGYADYKYAGGLSAAQRLANDTQAFGPALVGQQSPPPESAQTPLPEASPQPSPSPPEPSPEATSTI